MTIPTFLPGQTLTATLRDLRQAGVSVTSITDPDTLVCTVYSTTDVDQGVAGTILGDGLGNYTSTFLAPALPGDYYLLWTITVAGQIGKQRFDFRLRAQL